MPVGELQSSHWLSTVWLYVIYAVTNIIMICSMYLCRMASKFCDTDGRRTSKVIHTVLRPYYESSPADFASLYMAQNGIPLSGTSSYRKRRDSNELAVCTPLPLVHVGAMWPCDVSLTDVTCNSDDLSQTAFCNQYNIQSCLRYLDQVNFNSSDNFICYNSGSDVFYLCDTNSKCIFMTDCDLMVILVRSISALL